MQKYVRLRRGKAAQGAWECGAGAVPPRLTFGMARVRPKRFSAEYLLVLRYRSKGSCRCRIPTAHAGHRRWLCG